MATFVNKLHFVHTLSCINLFPPLLETMIAALIWVKVRDIKSKGFTQGILKT